MRRSILLNIWFFFAAVSTILLFVFVIHAVCSEEVYENSVVLTMKSSVLIGMVFAILQSILGKKIAKGEKNLSKVIDNFLIPEMNLLEWVYLVSYVIFGTMLYIFWMSWGLAFFGRKIGL